ncbi:MAG: hypothetical protein N2654_01570, partial [Deltaproteobacteria bacterium]|nr:hypothetical protein [Deltaproteobacteria bacterium]
MASLEQQFNAEQFLKSIVGQLEIPRGFEYEERKIREWVQEIVNCLESRQVKFTSRLKESISRFLNLAIAKGRKLESTQNAFGAVTHGQGTL